MIAAVAVLALIVLLLLYLHDRQVKAWSDERQILLERIQAPERVSIAPSGDTQPPLETDAPELALVGQIDDRPPLEEKHG